MAEIQFEDITKRYGDGYEAVKHFNLDISDGELMILVGPSGCGKSTALRMVAGLEDISDGELKIGGQVVNEKAPKDRDIAMVFQNYALYPHMTVRENMGFALKLAKVPAGRRSTARSHEAARILDLEQHLDRKPANLSGGQRQRVAMGRAIVRNPSAFLMDEPLSNLDAKLRVQMRTEIARIQHQLETTTIYVTHDQTEAMTLGDRIAVMRAGRAPAGRHPGRALLATRSTCSSPGFIGSPSMNFLPGEIDGDTVRLPIGAVRIPDELRHRLERAGGRRRRVIAGLRPEHFQDASLVSDSRNGTSFKTKIRVLESMGSEYYAYFDVAGRARVLARARRARTGYGRRRRRSVARGHPDGGATRCRQQGQPGRRRRAVVRRAPAAAVRRGERPEPARRRPAGAAGVSAERLSAAACPSRARPGCPGSTPSTTSCAPAAGRRLRGSRRDCGLSPTTSAVVLPYQEVVDALGFVGERDAGLQVVRIEAIVGTVDRERDFDRRFRPTSGRVRSRWEQIAAAMRRGDPLPPVDLYRIGEIYFVRDGHHRVSVVCALGHEQIDAYVTEVQTRVGADRTITLKPTCRSRAMSACSSSACRCAPRRAARSG